MDDGMTDEMSWNQYAVIITYFVYFSVGLVANLAIILVLMVSPVKTASTVHIIHLSLADTLLLTTLPLNADSRLNNSSWRFGWMACKANESLKMMNF